MYVFRLTTPLAALTHDSNSRMRIVTLKSGTIVRTRKDGPTLPNTGLVDVEVDGEDLAMFMQDLEHKAERVDESAA
jgi:hypothetical protein